MSPNRREIAVDFFNAKLKPTAQSWYALTFSGFTY